MMVFQQIGQRVDKSKIPGIVLAQLVAIVDLQAVPNRLVVLDGLQSAFSLLLLEKCAATGFPPFRFIVVQRGQHPGHTFVVTAHRGSTDRSLQVGQGHVSGNVGRSGSSGTLSQGKLRLTDARASGQPWPTQNFTGYPPTECCVQNVTISNCLLIVFRLFLVLRWY